jgi:hypothetical protein
MVDRMVCPCNACRSTLFGSSTIAWVILVKPWPLVRKFVVVAKFCSGNGVAKVGLPIEKGLRLMTGIDGPPLASLATPCARMVVPCGIEASRAT